MNLKGSEMDKDRVVDFTGRVTANPARDGPLVADLVSRARTGDKQSWDPLVERYAPLIWSICRTYRLGHADAQDVGQSVWLRLVDQLGKIRDPAALPGWLATTTRRECIRVLHTPCRTHAPIYALDAENLPDEQAGPADQELLAAERRAALREAFNRLPPDGQQLITILITDLRSPIPRSAPDSASPGAASARTDAAAWSSYAVIRLSPRSSTPQKSPAADRILSHRPVTKIRP
jgi:RNA polymerase sigma factor (sigma-70 family)